MLLYCLKCRQNKQSKNPKVGGIKNGRIILLSKRAVSDSKKFMKQQEASGLLSSLGIKTPLIKIPLLGPLLIWRSSQVNTRYRMNEIVNKFLLRGD